VKERYRNARELHNFVPSGITGGRAEFDSTHISVTLKQGSQMIWAERSSTNGGPEIPDRHLSTTKLSGDREFLPDLNRVRIVNPIGIRNLLVLAGIAVKMLGDLR